MHFRAIKIATIKFVNHKADRPILLITEIRSVFLFYIQQNALEECRYILKTKDFSVGNCKIYNIAMFFYINETTQSLLKCYNIANETHINLCIILHKINFRILNVRFRSKLRNEDDII